MKKMSVFDLYMEFPSPCGDKLQCCRLSVCPVCGKFPSPYGDGTNITTVDSRSDQFSPPYGDKLQSGSGVIAARAACFRPLTGINCNVCVCVCTTKHFTRFRPLAGRNCNSMCFRLMNRAFRFRPLAGNSLDIKKHGQTTDGFRPLTEYKFTIPHIESKEKNHTPEKRGWSRNDKP